ncbi:hypothetical protein BTJ11_09075 [Lactobacillus delbrueckii subsp. bulgaricus]|nr:hypothetical protein [Lactobacillus delbrueckii subsp. bulgaricus]
MVKTLAFTIKRKRLAVAGEPLFCIKKADSEESAENLKNFTLHPPYSRDPLTVFAGAGNGDQQTINSFLVLHNRYYMLGNTH